MLLLDRAVTSSYTLSIMTMSPSAAAWLQFWMQSCCLQPSPTCAELPYQRGFISAYTIGFVVFYAIVHAIHLLLAFWLYDGSSQRLFWLQVGCHFRCDFFSFTSICCCYFWIFLFLVAVTYTVSQN